MSEPQFPVLERIAQTIVTRLESVTKANGYNTEQAGISRPTRVESIQGKVASNYEIYLVQGQEELDEEHSTEGNPRVVAYKVTFAATLFVVPNDTDTTPVDQYINVFRADVMKALTSPANWQQFLDGADTEAGEDHLAINSWFDAPASIPSEDGDFDGVILPYVVNYRTPETDPYTVG